MIGVGILILILAVGVYVILYAGRHTTDILERLGAEPGAILPDGYTEEQVYRELKPFIDGIIDGTVRPEEVMKIFFRLFLDMTDGVLTRDELRGILEQARRIQGVHP